MAFLYGSSRDGYSLFVELWFCNGNMEKNHNIVSTTIFSSSVYMGSGIMGVVQDKPMVYEQEEVADVIAIKHGLMQKIYL